MKILIFAFLLNISSVSAKALMGKVVGIHDGDTITFLPEGSQKKAKLRLLGVDTPEIDFNGASQGEVAEKAMSFLKELLPLNANIQIELPSSGGMDINGRYLGQIFYEKEGRKEDLNLKMLQVGWGALYFIYPYDKKILVSYMNATKEASEKGLGIFSEKYKTQPFAYMFRQQIKGVPGTNLVADFETKKLYSSEDIESIPHYRRVFFSSEETALIHGFNW